MEEKENRSGKDRVEIGAGVFSPMEAMTPLAHPPASHARPSHLFIFYLCLSVVWNIMSPLGNIPIYFLT